MACALVICTPLTPRTFLGTTLYGSGYKYSVRRQLSSVTEEGVDPKEDHDWHTGVDLILTPDSSLAPRQRRGVEIDYGMRNGVVTVTCRKAMLFYTPRTLGFEISGESRKGERQVLIANLAEIEPFLPKFGQD